MGRSARILGLLRPYSLLFAVNMVTTVVASVLDGATFVLLIPVLRTLFGLQALPATGGSVVETVLGKVLGPFFAAGNTVGAVGSVAIILLVTLVVKNAALYAAAMSSVAIEEGVVRDLRVRLFRHLQTLPLGFFQRTRGGQLLARVVFDTDQVKTAVTAALASFLRNVSLIVVYLAILLGLSWRLTLIALVLAPVLVVIIRPVVARVRRRSRAQADDRGELTSLVSEMVASVKLVRAYVAEEFEVARFRRLADLYRTRVFGTQAASTLTSPISEIFAGVVLVLLLLFGISQLRPEVFIAFIVVALRLMSPVKAVAQYPTIMAGAVAAADRVFEVLDLPPDEGDAPGALPATFRDRIEYRGVSFSYDGGPPVLQEVSFDACRGQVVAIYEPTAGAILIDGVPISRFQRASLRGLMGIVSQETILLNDTVLANIAYGRGDFTLAQVEAAAGVANAHDFISQLPHGYDTLLGERGTRLSGGERQRIAIARALLRDPPILILDEATSALDMESERLVQEAMDRLMAHRTTFVIAHRLATVQHASLILVVAEGRLVERGTHSTLYASGGLYRRLYDMQFRT